MVHTAAVAFAVLALKAASTLAAPSQFAAELAERDFDGEDLDAREFDFDMDLDAREFDFEDMVEREIVEIDDDIFARATTTTTSSTTSSATATATGLNPVVTKATTTTTTHVAKPTGKNKKETKTVVITVLKPAAKCKKPSALERFKLRLKRAEVRRNARKAARKALLRAKYGLKATTTTSSAKSTSTTATSTTSTAKATGTTAAATKVNTADFMAITPPPTKSLLKGVQLKENKKKGKDGHTTIRRTVTAAPTACAVLTAKKSPHLLYRTRHRRDVEDMEDLMAREYDVDELD